MLDQIKIIHGEKIKSDENKILDRIFKERIKVDPSAEFSIAEMLNIKTIDTSKGEVLKYDNNTRRYGLRRYTINEKDYLAIDTDHPEIKKILRETPFQEYKEILQRHPFVIEKSKVIYMAGKNTRCIIFDWNKLEEKYFKEKEGIPF